MNFRSILIAIVAFAAGAVSSVLLLGRASAALPEVAAAGRLKQDSAKQADDVAELRAEVEQLKQKATDQAHVMVSVSFHYSNLWFAGQYGNWPLAEFYLNETRSHLRWAVRVIPIRKDNQGQAVDLRAILEAVENSPLKQLEEAIKSKDREKFADAYKFTLEACYACHKASDKPYLRTQIPRQPPDPVVNFEPLPPPFEKPPERFRLPEKANLENGRQASKQVAPADRAAAMLIEPAELQDRLRELKVRILDTRSNDQYTKGHIPGAVSVDVKSWQELGKQEGGFHDAEAWGEKVSRLGIAHDSEVVVYGSNQTDTARVWWTLKYLGLDSVAILNGGWDVWAKEQHPIETALPTVVPAQFKPKFQADRLEEIDSLKKSIQSDKVKVVDTRSTEEFTGKDVRGARGGHIPAATHLEWKELLAQDGRFKTPEQLRKLFLERGILPDETAVCY